MPRVTEVLRNAQTLADFSNLEATQVDYFRHNFPDFVPEKWWEHRDGKQWRMTQDFLRESWANKFNGGPYFVARLILSVFDPSQTIVTGMDEMFPGTSKEGPEQVFAIPGDFPWGTTPFQMAVLHLFEHPWRARFCEECRKRFIAVEPKNKFCSPACSDVYRTRKKLDWWKKHGNAWRRKRKRKART